ncbi:hypothetical protein ACWCQN_30225 [Streptomyces sp. NPDC001984]
MRPVAWFSDVPVDDEADLCRNGREGSLVRCLFLLPVFGYHSVDACVEQPARVCVDVEELVDSRAEQLVELDQVLQLDLFAAPGADRVGEGDSGTARRPTSKLLVGHRCLGGGESLRDFATGNVLSDAIRRWQQPVGR